MSKGKHWTKPGWTKPAELRRNPAAGSLRQHGRRVEGDKRAKLRDRAAKAELR